jgi:hypothetical protein
MQKRNISEKRIFSDVSVFSTNVVHILQELNSATFRHLNARDSGRWSLLRGDSSLGFGQEELEPDRAFLVQLHEAIPVPDQDVALQEVLEFKERRRAELLALRHHLEKIYLDVIRSPDRALAGAVALEEVDRAICDVLKVSRETGMKLKLSGFDASLQLFDVNQAILGAAAGWESGLGITGAVLGGVVGGVIPKLTFKTGLGLRSTQRSDSPFEYVARFHRELF